MRYRGVNYNPNIRGHWLTKQAIDMNLHLMENDELAKEMGIERFVQHEEGIYSRFDRRFTYRGQDRGGVSQKEDKNA